MVKRHDCFVDKKLFRYEALGLRPVDGAEKFDCDGDNTDGGKMDTTPSGGLPGKDHLLGAAGLPQCYELAHLLRGAADQRQAEVARPALQHNLGLGGACGVAL